MPSPHSTGIDLAVQLTCILPASRGWSKNADPVTSSSVARAMGLHPSSVHAWRTGRRRVPDQYVPALAAALGMTVDELVALVPTDEPEQEFVQAIPVAMTTPRYELYCMMCGRGTGSGGALRSTSTLPPIWAAPKCGVCGGVMMAREVEPVESRVDFDKLMRVAA